MLSKIRAWAERSDGQCIFWLKGVAGAGKSAIARTVARDYDKENRLAASFFFSRDGGDVNRADKFVTTIARQLARTSGDLRHHICKAISDDEDIVSKTLSDQWSQLVLGPLSRLGTACSESSIIIVVDALDECEGNWKTLKFLVQVLTEVNSLSNIRVRVLLTSRPDADVRVALAGLDDVQCLQYDLLGQDAYTDDVETNEDISKFFRAEFEEIRAISENSTHIPPNWPGDDIIDLLVKKAEGLFIYAATICGFIKSNDHWPRDKLLQVVLVHNEKSTQEEANNLPAASPTKELDALYLQVLNHSLRGAQEGTEREKLLGIFKQIVGSIVTLSEPLSVTALRELLGLDPETVHLRLRHLHSVLHIPSDDTSPINLWHPSFREFLLDRKRHNSKGRQEFWVDEVQAHNNLAARCIELMSITLQKPDLCDLRLPGVAMTDVKESSVNECVPPELRYACVHWVYHIEKGHFGLSSGNKIEEFLRLRLLCWIEVLALTGKISNGVQMLSRLQSLVVSRSKGSVYLPLGYANLDTSKGWKPSTTELPA